MNIQKTPTIKDLMESKKLRKIHSLYICHKMENQYHLYTLVSPLPQKFNIYEWYKFDYKYRFSKTESRAHLLYQCIYCNKQHITISDICRDCKRLKRPITKKLEAQLFSFQYLVCICVTCCTEEEKRNNPKLIHFNEIPDKKHI